MKALFILISLISSSYVLAENQKIINLNKEAKIKVQMFGKQLKSTLKAGINQGGFEEGINICSQSANSIALAHSSDGWLVNRTSLKVRNTANAPDAWELKQLKQFERQLNQGVKAEKLVFSEVVFNQNNNKTFRFMKAIPTGNLCLKCHGSNLEPNIQESLNKQYPNDQATGYKLGDIRGAFTLTKQLK